jgi:hypothetical protein
VIAGADPTLDDPAIRNDLQTLAEQGKLLAAAGQLKLATSLPPGHPFRKPAAGGTTS